MAKKEAVGFASQKSKKQKAPESAVIYSNKFYGLIPGDVCLSAEASLKALNLELEEVTTFRMSMSGHEEEIPFIRYRAEDGTEIPYGTWRVDGLGDLSISVSSSGTPTISLICALIDKSAKPIWDSLVKQVYEQARTNSIFRGKALQVFEPQDLLVPRTLDLSRELKAFFNDDIEKSLETCVMWPLVNRATAKEKGIRVRRGSLLEGHYGCGKSIFLYNASRAAHKAGWTVVNLAPGMISVASMIAPLLAPVALIVEDVDSGTHGDRDALNPILNSLSSIGTKCTDDFHLIVSTNFLGRIEPAILRPERIDAVIRVDLPDRKTIHRLIKEFSHGKLDPNSAFIPAVEAMLGCTPAIIGEIVQRCLIDNERSGAPFITEASLLEYTAQMEFQKDMAVPVYKSDTIGDQLAKNLHDVADGNF